MNDPRNGSWFLFNDETVTKIKSLGEKPSLKKSNGENTGDEEKR